MSNVHVLIPKYVEERPSYYNEIDGYLNRLYRLYDGCDAYHMELLLYNPKIFFGAERKSILLPHATRIFKLFNRTYANLATMDLTSTIIPNFSILEWNSDILDVSVRINDAESEDLIVVWRFAIINKLEDEIRLGRHDHDYDMQQFRQMLDVSDVDDPKIRRLGSKQCDAFRWFTEHCTGNDMPQPRNAFMTLFNVEPDKGVTNKFYTYGYATYLPIANTEHHLLAEVTFPKIN